MCAFLLLVLFLCYHRKPELPPPLSFETIWRLETRRAWLALPSTVSMYLPHHVHDNTRQAQWAGQKRCDTPVHFTRGAASIRMDESGDVASV